MQEGPKQWIGGELLERANRLTSFVINTSKGQEN